MNIKKIYFDLDGVLADFDRGVRELCGMIDGTHGLENQANDDAMWHEIRKIDHFYDKLELMPGSLAMFRAIYDKYGDKCEILSAIPKPKRGIITAGDDKIAWAHRMLSPDIVVNIVYSEQKKDFCAGKDCILIDDLPKNVNAWIDAGGTGILHLNPMITLGTLRELNLI